MSNFFNFQDKIFLYMEVWVNKTIYILKVYLEEGMETQKLCFKKLTFFIMRAWWCILFLSLWRYELRETYSKMYQKEFENSFK